MLEVYDHFYSNKSYNVDIPAFIINESISEAKVKKMSENFKANFVQRTDDLEEVCEEYAKHIFVERRRREKEEKASQKKIKSKEIAKSCGAFTIALFLLSAIFIAPGISKYFPTKMVFPPKKRFSKFFRIH